MGEGTTPDTGIGGLGAALAAVFGVATVPALLGFGLLVSWLGARGRGLVYRAGGVAVIVMGLVFIRRGILNLGTL